MTARVDTGFHHRGPGTDEAVWAPVLAGLPTRPVPEGPLVVLAAHPDDETLGAGGLIATAAGRGQEVTVVVATLGEGSHPDSPTHTPGGLATLRRWEVTAAVSRLAPRATLRLLDLPDGRLTEHHAALDEALADVVTADTLLVAPYRADRHPDHDACGAAAARVAQGVGAELWEYPVWLWHWGGPDDLPRSRAHTVTLGPARSTKAAALSEHVSQHRDLSSAPGDEAILPPPVVAHFERDVECFVAAAPAARPAYFDALYAEADDPWGLDTRFYETRKRDLLLAALPRPRFRRAFEPGCATGALTVELLDRVDQVVAWDVADGARALAARRLGSTPFLDLGAGQIPGDWPEGGFDLIVLSEVGYYCEDLALLGQRVQDSLTDDGVLVACHWRHAAPDHPHPAATVHTELGRGLHRDVHHVEADFLLDVWSRTGESVARRDGVL